MAQGRRLESLRFLLRDRDSKYTRTFDAVFETDDMEILLSPPQAPKANTICERVVGTLRCELLDRMLIYNEAHARAVSPGRIPPALQRAPSAPVPAATAPGQRRTGHSGHRHQPPGPPDPASTPPGRPDQPVREKRLTERPRRSSQHRIVFSSGTGCCMAVPAGADGAVPYVEVSCVDAVHGCRCCWPASARLRTIPGAVRSARGQRGRTA
jgi:hypothetical protein